MKTILAALALLVTVQAQAAARTIEFDTVRVDGKLQASAGITTIDDVKKTIVVSVVTDNCPAGAVCVAGPLIQTYQAPLQKVTDTGCETLTEGSEDRRPVDGYKTTIQFEDNSENTCEAGGLVDSLYKTTVTVEGVSRMSGKSVKRVIELKNSSNAP